MTQALQFFQEKQKEDPNFFYRIVIDEDKKVKHMFWADETSLKYYEMYGDCISFDTTYMTVTPGFKGQSRVHLIHAPRRQHI
jgi:hypothetical protein